MSQGAKGRRLIVGLGVTNLRRELSKKVADARGSLKQQLPVPCLRVGVSCSQGLNVQASAGSSALLRAKTGLFV